MPFYPNQRCQRYYHQSGCSAQRPVPEPRQHAESNCPCKNNLNLTSERTRSCNQTSGTATSSNMQQNLSRSSRSNQNTSCNCSSTADSGRSERTVPANNSFSGNRAVSDSDCPCHRADACEHRRTMPEDPVIAMAYVPWQRWANLSNRSNALQQGTIFADLNKPFSGKGGHCR